MKISYRFFQNFDKKDVLKLKELGITVKEGCDAYVAYEGTHAFETLKAFFGENWRECVSIVDTNFTEKERTESFHLNISATKILGYPQPEERNEGKEEQEPESPFNIYPYYENVFEVAATSPNYGILKGNQIGSFSFLKEPKWGKASIGSVFWSLNDFFVTPETYYTIFEPLNIECRSVLKYKTKKPLETVLQIIPQGISQSKLNIPSELIKEMSEIPEWKMRKCLFEMKGFYPSFETSPGDYDFFVSQEYFGTGGVTEREVFISQRLYQRLRTRNIKGLKYYPQINND